MNRQLTYLIINKTFNLEEFNMLSFVIENKKYLYDVELHVRLDFPKHTSLFTLSVDNKDEEITDNIEVIDNIFCLDLNTKKNINSLYKILKSFYKSDIKEGIDEIKNRMSFIIKDIAIDFDLSLSFSDEIREEDIFKLFDLKFDDEENDIVKRIIKYIEVSYELRKTTIFWLFHIHEYLEKSQIEDLLKELSYKDIKIINIEPNFSFEKCDNEQIFIIDNDLCSF
ncbi:MAG: type II-A CRISPR-associated protein Csn2 [Bacilli bacterium]